MQRGLRRKRVHYAEEALAEDGRCDRCGAPLNERSAPHTLETLLGREVLVLVPYPLPAMRFESVSCLYSTVVDALPRQRAFFHRLVQERAERKGLTCVYVNAGQAPRGAPKEEEPEPALDFSWVGNAEEEPTGAEEEERAATRQGAQEPVEDVVMSAAYECGASGPCAATSAPL